MERPPKKARLDSKASDDGESSDFCSVPFRPTSWHDDAPTEPGSPDRWVEEFLRADLAKKPLQRQADSPSVEKLRKDYHGQKGLRTETLQMGPPEEGGKEATS